MIRHFRRMLYAALAAGEFLCLLIAVQRPAYGYVDPGSGILVAQFVSSILGGGIFFLRKKLKQLFHPLKEAGASERKSEIKL